MNRRTNEKGVLAIDVWWWGAIGAVIWAVFFALVGSLSGFVVLMAASIAMLWFWHRMENRQREWEQFLALMKLVRMREEGKRGEVAKAERRESQRDRGSVEEARLASDRHVAGGAERGAGVSGPDGDSRGAGDSL